ncbi:hypothetical protein DL96DRAFT_1472740 [Flagelloscypha sp. PMI_526]|nr:hypothetical protein DL96DRAFT_1472740 [Flagelloscypha sp. PMI_526]
MLSHFWVVLLGLYARAIAGGVTVYHPPDVTRLSAYVQYTSAAAYDMLQLHPPPMPNPSPSQNFFLQLVTNPPGLSIPVSSSFLGFSIEMSVAESICTTLLNVPFLNLMANIAQRSGGVVVRIGGNSQERATQVSSLAHGRVVDRVGLNYIHPNPTSDLVYTADLLQMFRQISGLVTVKWFLGIPFNDTSMWRLDIVSTAEQILGPYVLGYQVGNEPNLYTRHGLRPLGYTAGDYLREVSSMSAALTELGYGTARERLVGAATAHTGEWSQDDIARPGGFSEDYASKFAYLALEKYPSDNCAVQFPDSGIMAKDPQLEFERFLKHSSPKTFLQPYLHYSMFAQSQGKPLLMFETNSASCGGFPGLSDSFGIALWAVDYTFQMAYFNFSGALFHIGGQVGLHSTWTFFPPPWNQTPFRQWTIGPVYYASLVIAEALFSTSNTARVLELPSQSDLVSVYAVYDTDVKPTKLVLINYMDDGQSDKGVVRVSFDIGGGLTGQDGHSINHSSSYGYLLAPSVSSKYNITWAGQQTWGMPFSSDGRAQGNEENKIIPCRSSICTISVPAPGLALVFLKPSEVEHLAVPSKTFATTITPAHRTAVVDPLVLATSNGHGGARGFGSTSEGSFFLSNSDRIFCVNLCTILTFIVARSLFLPYA